MQRNILMTEDLAVAGEIHPVSQGVGSVSTAAINMGLFGAVVFEVEVGAVGAAGTVDFLVQASATSGGTYADVSGTAITQITVSNTKALIEVRAARLTDLGVGPFIKGKVTIGGNAVLISLSALGSKGPYYPNSDNNLASVAQKVVL